MILTKSFSLKKGTGQPTVVNSDYHLSSRPKPDKTKPKVQNIGAYGNILDGNSEHVAPLWTKTGLFLNDFQIFNCSQSKQLFLKQFKSLVSIHTCAIFSELPSNVNALVEKRMLAVFQDLFQSTQVRNIPEHIHPLHYISALIYSCLSSLLANLTSAFEIYSPSIIQDDISEIDAHV